MTTCRQDWGPLGTWRTIVASLPLSPISANWLSLSTRVSQVLYLNCFFPLCSRVSWYSAGSWPEELHPWQRSWGRRLGIRKGGIEPQESPWKFSSIYPQNQSLPTFCFLLSPTPLTLQGAVPHHHLSLWKRVNLQLQLIKFLGVTRMFQPTNSFGSPLACLNRFFRPHVIVQSLPTVRGMRCSKLSKYRFLWAVKRLIRNCIGEGFSFVGPMFAAKSPYPLPAVSLAVYWLI